MTSATRRRRVVRTGAAIVLALAAVVAVAVTAGRNAVNGTGTGPCAGVTVRAAGHPTWHCTFDDEFGAQQVDASKWTPLVSASTGFRGGGAECFVGDRQHVSVRGGDLALTLTRSDVPVACGTGAATGYLSGMLTSVHRFAQRYGRFEIGARFPTGVGLQSALWLMPEDSAYGAWPRSGEIDIAEAYGAAPDAVQPHLHYLGADGTESAPGATCTVPNSTGGFHVYGVTWTPTQISVDYDGRTCRTFRNWRPAPPQADPAPFDRAFFVNLTLGLGGAATPGNVPGAATPARASLLVDYVRVWGA